MTLLNTTLKFAVLLLGSAVLMNGCGKQEAPLARTAEASLPSSPPQPPSAVVAAPSIAATATPTPMELAAKRGCLACHAVDKTLVGPAYQDIAKKYTTADEAKLIAKVKAGGSGVWGKIPMPPNPQVNDEELKRLVQWILAGAK